MTTIEDLVLKHRDIYMNYRELADKCIIDISQIGMIYFLSFLYSSSINNDFK